MKPAASLAATLRVVALPAIAINAAVLWVLRDNLGNVGAGLHAPDWSLLARQGWVIQLHLLAALSALVVAMYMLSAAKGSRAHRVVGWASVVLMMTTALSSFFIRELDPGKLSWIHILSGWTAIAAPIGVWAARTHRVLLHQRFMTGIVVGGLVIAGGFSFLPGRLMWRVLFG